MEKMGRRPKSLEDMKCNASSFRQKNKTEKNDLSTWLHLQPFKTLNYLTYTDMTGERLGAGSQNLPTRVVKTESRDVVRPVTAGEGQGG